MMQLFHSALLTGETSNTFTVHRTGYFVFFVTGTTAAEVFTMQMAPEPNGTFVTYLPDGVSQTIATAQLDYVRSYLAAGQTFRLLGDGGGDGTTTVNCYAGGDLFI